MTQLTWDLEKEEINVIPPNPCIYRALCFGGLSDLRMLDLWQAPAPLKLNTFYGFQAQIGFSQRLNRKKIKKNGSALTSVNFVEI